jgi:hypothetical protein
VRHCLLDRRDRTLLLRLLLDVAGQRTGVVLQRCYRCLLVWCKRLLRCVGEWWCACRLHRREQILQTFRIERSDELLQTWRDSTQRSASSWGVRGRCAVTGRESRRRHRRHAVCRLSLLAVAVRLGRRLLWRLVTPHALFLSQDELYADLEVLVVVVVELDVVRTRTGTVEEAKINQPGILIRATKTTDSEHSLHELPTNNSIEVQTWAQIEDINRESTTLEGLLDPVDKVAVEILVGDDLHIRNILRRALWQRQPVVRVGRTRTSAEPATSVVLRRTGAVSLIAVSVASRRRRWRAVWSVTVSVAFATISAVSSVSSVPATVIAWAPACISIIADSVIVRRTRASTCVYRTRIRACVLLWVSVTLRFADFQICTR